MLAASKRGLVVLGKSCIFAAFIFNPKNKKIMPTLFTIFGLRFFFYSEEHLPIHIHVQKGKGKAKFNVIPTVSLVESKGLKAQEISLAQSLVEENRDVIIERWNTHLNQNQEINL